jgi:flavodoxin
MKSLVIYHSKFGNTRQIAENIADVLKTNGTVQIRTLDEITSSDFQEASLVVMGAPTHKMNLPESLRPKISNLPKKVLKGKYVAAFDTSYQMSPFLNRLTAGKKIAQKLRKLGGKLLISPEIFVVKEKEGPLLDGELERSQTWAQNILAAMAKKVGFS